MINKTPKKFSYKDFVTVETSVDKEITKTFEYKKKGTGPKGVPIVLEFVCGNHHHNKKLTDIARKLNMAGDNGLPVITSKSTVDEVGHHENILAAKTFPYAVVVGWNLQTAEGQEIPYHEKGCEELLLDMANEYPDEFNRFFVAATDVESFEIETKLNKEAAVEKGKRSGSSPKAK